MKWILLIATTVNGPGFEIAQYETHAQCNKASTIIELLGRSVSEERGSGAVSAPDLYGQCWRQGDPRIPRDSVLVDKENARDEG